MHVRAFPREMLHLRLPKVRRGHHAAARFGPGTGILLRRFEISKADEVDQGPLFGGWDFREFSLAANAPERGARTAMGSSIPAPAAREQTIGITRI